MRSFLLAIAIAAAAFVAPPQIAVAQSTPSPAPCTVPFIFIPLTVAQAPQVNANFAALEGCINNFSAQATPSPAATSTGCGTLTWAGTFGTSDYESVLDTSACGGGGSFTCNAVNSCVTFQTSPSPSPEATDAGGNSAAVAGILQGGTVYSQFGRFQTTGNFLIPCPAQDCAHWQWQSLSSGADIGTTYTGPFSETEPSTQNSVPGVCFGWGCPNANVMPVNNFGVNLGAGVGNEEIYLNLEHRPDGAGRANVVIGSSGSTGGGSVNLQAANIVLRDNEPGGVTPAEVSIVGDVFVQRGGLWDNGPNPQSGTFAWAGHCAMSSNTSCSITTQAAYTSSLTAGYCIAQAQSATPIEAACAMSGTTATVTAATSNSQTWAIMTFGAASP